MSELANEDFDKMKSIDCNLEEEKFNQKEKLKEVYRNIIDIIRKYCDLKEDYYPLIATWIIGSWFHNTFHTYPYLFLNAMKGSGKTRLLKLITLLSKDGSLLTSLTEAVLFRTDGTLGIDEFEGLSRKGNENLRELLNASYKRGLTVKRLKKQKTDKGEEQVVEEFDVFRPIVMANIWGMENVLGDRCIPIILERSNDRRRIKLVENFDFDIEIKTTLTTLNYIKNHESCSLCSVVVAENLYKGWNNYILGEDISTLTTHTYNYTNYIQLYKTIDETEIDGRNLELAFPLLIIASEIGEEVLSNLIKVIKIIVDKRRNEDFNENKDILLIDFLSQETPTDNFISINELVKKFKEFINTTDDSINNRWIGRALMRLNLVREKKRMGGGVKVKLNIEKAQEKVLMFK